MRFKTEITLIVILVLILATVTFTGYITYQKLTKIVTTVNEEIKPDTRLLTARSLVNNLNDAELSVKSYRITRDTIYLDGFYTSIAQVDSSLESLHSFDVEQVNLDMNQLDSLIDLKLDVLNELMFLQGGERTQKALDRVVDQIEYVEYRPREELNETAAEEDQEEKNRFFNRLFNWKSRKDSIVPEPDPEAVERREILTLETVNEEVDEIKEDERRFDMEYRTLELALIQRDKVISDQIIEFFDQLEKFELDEIEAESRATEVAITNANDQLVLFFMFIGALLLFMAFMIFNYFRNNNRFKKALKKSEKEARELAELKERFLSKMSHEIRTPMNAIIGFTEQVSKGPLNSEQREHLGRVMNASDHMVYLLNEILDLSKLRANKIQLEEIAFSPAELLENVQAYLKNETSKKAVAAELSLPTNLPDVLVGDPYRLRQILYNLTNNAIKFTESGSIKLDVRTALKGNTCLLAIDVIDSGKGIAEDRIDKIFNEFEQEDNSVERKFGGTGLGLAIVKQIVDLSNGELAIRSELGKGTTIAIKIPYKLNDQNNTKNRGDMRNQEIEALDLSRFKILVVDDEPLNRMILQKILKPVGASLIEAGDGLEAIEKCKDEHFDMVLMDVRMPQLNGVDATIKIRDLDVETSNVPIVALTAAVSDVDKEAFIKAGMNGLILKPFKEEELLSALGQIIKKLNIVPQNNSSEIQLNLEMLEEMGEGDRSFIVDMLQTFRSGLSEALELAEKGVENEAFIEIADAVHKAGPSCHHMGAMKLYEAMRELEWGIRKNELTSMSEIKSRVNVIKKESHEVFEAIDRELKEI